MAQNDQIRPMVLVLAGENTMYLGEYDGRNGDNICLLNVRCILYCKEPYYKVCSKGARCVLSSKLDSAEIKDVERSVKLSDKVSNMLLANPVMHDSNVYDFDAGHKNELYKSLHLAKVNGTDIKNIQGHAVGTTLVKGKVAHGFVLNLMLSVYPCYTVTFGETTGVGNSLHSAYENAKMLVLGCKVHGFNGYDYAEYVVNKYPDVDKKVPVIELIELHNLITNSCSKGIRRFLMSYNINIDGTASMRTFLTLTKNAYAPEVIESIANRYGITI